MQRLRGGACVVLACALLACGGGDDDPEAAATTNRDTARSTTTTERSTTTTTAAPTTTTTIRPDSPEAVLADYRLAWDSAVAGLTANPPDPNFPGLVDRWRDGSLERIQGFIVEVRDRGLFGRGNVEVRPRAPEVDGTEAVLFDCWIDTTEGVDPATNQVVIPAPGINPAEVRLRLEDGRWRVYDDILREDMQGELCG